MATKTDPRIAELAGKATANEEAMAWTIRRSLLNLRLANGEARKILGFLNRDVLPDVLRKLRDRLEDEDRRGNQITTESSRRLASLARVIDETLSKGFLKAHDDLAGSLREIAVAEAGAVTQRLGMIVSPGVGVSFVAPGPTLLDAIVTKSSFNGDLLKNWFDIQNDRARLSILREINTGMAQGETVDSIIRRVRGTSENDFEDGVLDATRRETETLVRTAVRHTTEQARQITYQHNDDVVEGYMWVATLDHRTCLICAPLDGTTWKLADNAQRAPPAHPNCRCGTTPVLKSFKALGLNADEIKPSERASMNGTVPATQTYGEWLKGQPQWLQNEVLGVGKAAMFRAGRLDIGDFVDARDRILTLEDLTRLESSHN